MIDIEIVVVQLVKLGRISTSTQDLCIVKKFKIVNLTFFYQSRKPTIIGVLDRPPTLAEFMELVIEKISNLNLKDNELSLLGDFTINLFQNGNYILN